MVQLWKDDLEAIIVKAKGAHTPYSVQFLYWFYW